MILRKHPIASSAAALALVALLAAPFVAYAAPGLQETGEALGEGPRIHVVTSPDGAEVHRQVEIITVDESGETTGEGGERKNVRIVVASPGEDGEAQRFVWKGQSEDGGDFVWKNADGEVVEFEGLPGQNFFFSPGVERGFLGVELTDLTDDLRLHFGAQEGRGVMVARIVPESPAQRAGLRVGDVLTHVDGEPVSGSFDVTSRIGGHSAGEIVALEVIRDGRVETLSAAVEMRERPQVEVRKLLGRIGEGGEHVYHFDSGELEEQMEGVRAYFESPEWKRAMSDMGDELRQKLEALEIELDGLEQRLEIEIDEDIDTDIHP